MAREVGPPAKKAPAKRATKRTPAKAAPRKAAPRKAAAKKAPAKKAPAKRAPRQLAAVPDLKPGADTAPEAESPPPPAGPPDPYALPELFDPQYEAHRLHLAGMPWREVAQRTGYASEAAVMGAVHGYLQKAAIARSADQQQMALQTQIERYQALIFAWWAKATKDLDAAAANTVLRAMAQMDKVQRFGELEVEKVGRTIVISGTPEEYIAQLKEIVEGDGPAGE